MARSSVDPAKLGATGENYSALTRAVTVLRAGGVVAHATEGVWGLTCDPENESAVRQLLQIKSRSVDKGLILIGADAAQFAPELDAISPAQQTTVTSTWPGAVTWVLPNQRFAPWITGSHRSVAIRVPGHDQARALCAQFGGPLVSTSANSAGQPAATTQAEATAAMGELVDLVLPGQTSGNPGPSTIRQLDGRQVR